MNTGYMKQELVKWIKDLKEAAKNDEKFLVSWFKETCDSPVAIVGGWENGFDVRDSDIFCLSKSNPTYGMCIKIILNRGPYAYADFEVLDMPVEDNGEVDDTCLTLEWDDNPAAVADFFITELERITNAYNLGMYGN